MNRQQGQRKGSNLTVGISATLLPDENSCHKFPSLSYSNQLFVFNCHRLVNTNTILDD